MLLLQVKNFFNQELPEQTIVYAYPTVEKLS